MATGKRTAPRHGIGSRRWRPGIAWLALGAVAVAGLGIAARYGPDDGRSASPAAAAAPKPITPQVHQVALAAPATGPVRLAPRRTERFSLLAVTWDDPLTVLAGDVQVRTRSVAGGRWSGWASIGIDADVDARPGTRGGTAPLWVGPSDGAELRIEGRPAAKLPAGMRLVLIDPDRAGVQRAAFLMDDPLPPSTTTSAEPADPSTTSSTTTTTTDPITTTGPITTSTTAQLTTTTTTTTTRVTTTTTKPTTTTTTPLPPAPVSSVARPAITSRAGWQADESLREAGDPGYAAGIKAVFVHHTDSGTNVTCAQSASLIRGIYAYHVVSRGWADIGYNFLVDACGTIFEGRHGGVDRPVIGAHTYGFNTNSTGIAMIGTYINTQPTPAALAAVARVAAWKLGQYKVSPSGSTTLVEGVADSSGFTLGQSYPFRTVSGHRDGVATECPGDALYAQLPTIRTWASSIATPVLTGFGAQLSGGVRYTGSSIVFTWKDTTPAGMVNRYDTLIDGKIVATSTAGARSVRAPVPAGRHTLQLRVRYSDGSLAAPATVAVFGDVTAPTFPGAPATRLRAGTVSGTAIPVYATWKAADNGVLARVQATAPGAATFAPATTAWATTIAPGAARAFSLKALDLVGNARAVSWTATPVLVAESAGTRTGAWSTRKGSGYLGAAALGASAANASLSWTFTGRGVAWVATRSATSGQGRVYVDGHLLATVDLRASATVNRQIVWTWAAATAAKHTVKIVVVGTKGRPTVITDGLVILR